MASLELEAPLANNESKKQDNIFITEIENDSSTSSLPMPNGAVSDEEWVYPHPTDFKLTEAPIDEPRALKVAVIGAGLTGITAGVLLPAKVPGINLTIFEKNADAVRIIASIDEAHMLTRDRRVGHGTKTSIPG